MLEVLENITGKMSSIAWGLPLLIILIGGGLYLIARIKFLPFRYLGHAIAVLRGKYDNENDTDGDPILQQPQGNKFGSKFNCFGICFKHCIRNKKEKHSNSR